MYLVQNILGFTTRTCLQWSYFNVASAQFAMGRYKPGSTGVDWTGDYTSGVTFYAPSHFSGAIQYI